MLFLMAHPNNLIISQRWAPRTNTWKTEFPHTTLEDNSAQQPGSHVSRHLCLGVSKLTLKTLTVFAALSFAFQMTVLEENVLPRYKCGRPSGQEGKQATRTPGPAHRLSSNAAPQALGPPALCHTLQGVGPRSQENPTC